MDNKELYNRLQAVYNELVDIVDNVDQFDLTQLDSANPNFYDIHKSIEYLEQVSKRLNGAE